MIIRSDDFDPRVCDPVNFELFKQHHEEFKKRNMVMTITVNNCMGQRIGFTQEVKDYVNANLDNLDPQLHGWEHDRFYAMDYKDAYLLLAANQLETKRDFPESNPHIFYPPWNRTNEQADKAAKDLGIEVIIADTHIRQYLWVKTDIDVIFSHWWDKADLEIMGQVLDKIKGGKNGQKTANDETCPDREKH